MDILFKTDDFVFSYRVAGICMQNGKVLLQKPSNDTGYAFPGGHVTLGETNAQTLIREFQEEIPGKYLLIDGSDFNYQSNEADLARIDKFLRG